MFESLSDKLQDIISKTSGQSELTQENMHDALREIRRALLEADVNLRVVKSFISNIKDRAEGEDVIRGVNPSQQLVKIVHDELIKLLGNETSPLDFSGNPNLIMMLGLQGSGKTTSSAKLAVKLKKEGRNPLLVACDIYRPAAITQIKTLGEQIGVEVYSKESQNVQEIIQSAISYAKENNFNTLILDTAGRLQIDTEMMAELLLIDRVFHPSEKLLVIDSMTGQEAVNVSENFDAQLGVTGLVLTKLDGDSRGGAALSVVYCTGKPIKLTGTGEKLSALEDFYPQRMADRILGMGDIVSLVERAQEVFDEKTAKEMEKKMSKAEFSFNDFLKMQSQMKMFGSMEQILGMIPGLKISKDDKQKLSHESEKQFKRIEVFIQSMTPEEREHPELMNSSRKKRISLGSGIPLHDINIFINQFEQMRKMMKGMSDLKSTMSKMGNKFGAQGAGKLSMHQMMKNMRRFK
jgi:signal recognition particle subunit SRP54